MTLFESLRSPNTESRLWQIGTLLSIVVFMIAYFLTAFWYTQTYGQFRSNPASIKNLLTIRNHDLSTAIGNLKSNTASVCTKIINKDRLYTSFTPEKTALVNWRPLTVRLAGYLGGIHTARDGVFDTQSGIQHALDQGARAFVFDIDYLDESPCAAVLIHRDSKGYMRSLNTGSIKDACKRLTDKAFQTNHDPVLIIIYLRRIPPALNQQKRFFSSIASSLNPLSTYHLGMNSQGSYYNCKSESSLFTSPITDFQNKFIVMTNYNTNQIPATGNPKDNLDFWTNARIYQDPSGKSDSMGSVISSAPPGQIAYAQAGSTDQLINIGTKDQANYKTITSNIFSIGLSDVEYSFTTLQMNTLLNTLGIQCVPIDVVRLAAEPEHEKSIKLASTSTPSVADLSNSNNSNDVLSFWIHAGWSRKLIVEGFSNPSPVPPATPIPGFIIRSPALPKKPPPSTNSNGGLLTIGQ
jgi:hypothetical protein